MTKPIITDVEMAKNLVEMTYDANLVYEDEFECEFERFKYLFHRDSWIYFNDAERALIREQLYNVFWSIKLVKSDEKNFNDENDDDDTRKFHLLHNPIYTEIKWENECDYYGQSDNFEHINQVYLLRKGLKTYFKK
jgi:hypothetical protein